MPKKVRLKNRFKDRKHPCNLPWWGWCFVLVFLPSCFGQFVPYPDRVHVPHPDQLESGFSRTELLEMYATSPNRNPDGLGALEEIEPNSYMVLVVKAVKDEMQQNNRLVYARTEAEQKKVLRQNQEFFKKHLIIEGALRSLVYRWVLLEWYGSEGVYLLDDKGRKFLPIRKWMSDEQQTGSYLSVTIKDDDQEKKIELEFKSKYQPEYDGNLDSGIYTTYLGLIFPREVLTPQTRALTLYFAAVQKRASFTWIFDENYIPTLQSGEESHDKGFKRMWRR